MPHKRIYDSVLKAVQILLQALKPRILEKSICCRFLFMVNLSFFVNLQIGLSSRKEILEGRMEFKFKMCRVSMFKSCNGILAEWKCREMLLTYKNICSHLLSSQSILLFVGSERVKQKLKL